jgi:hypothetical protein
MAPLRLRSLLILVGLGLTTMAFMHTYLEAREFASQRYAAIAAAVAARDAMGSGRLAAIFAAFLFMFAKEMLGQAREIRNALSEIIPGFVKKTFWVSLQISWIICRAITVMGVTFFSFLLPLTVYHNVFHGLTEKNLLIASAITVLPLGVYLSMNMFPELLDGYHERRWREETERRQPRSISRVVS